jgi:hypothetical protein
LKLKAPERQIGLPAAGFGLRARHASKLAHGKALEPKLC